MPSPLRDPKSLFDWLELDYYRRPSRLRRIRYVVIWLVFLLTGVALAGTIWLGKRSIYQAGPLSTAHTLFNNDCARCHTDAFQTARRLWPGNAHFRSVKDDACKECHDGTIHQEQQVGSPSCSSCHQEHRGRPRLVQVSNDHCTACHADLPLKDGGQPHFQNVEAFAGNHPEFALWRGGEAKDPGHLAFNHQVHLNLKAKDMAGPDGKPLGKELECQSCHKLDGDRRYMAPINYEKHCAECHPLSVQLDTGAPAAGRLGAGCAEKEAVKFRAQPAPHKAPDVVRAALRDRLTELVRRCPEVLQTGSFGIPERSLPGKQREADKQGELEWIKRQLHQSERMLFDGAAGCRYCHTVKDPSSSRNKDLDLPEYLKTEVPNRWYPHSRFSHDSHRSLTCAECHVAEKSVSSRDVLMPQLGTCQKCHSPQGARSDCVDCHSYHHRGEEKEWKGKMKINELSR